VSEDEPVDFTDSGTGMVLQRVYSGIRHAIIIGEFPQGMKLNEQRLANYFNVSRVPLRESMKLLERDGFITALPRRSAVVSIWTASRARDLFDARLGLEVEAARYAARQVALGASTDDIRARLEESDASVKVGNDLEIAEASTAFHVAIVQLTGNRLLQSLMHTISHEMTWLFYLTSQRDSQKACDEHHELLDAICSGNEELAKAVAYTHIELGREPSLAAFAASGELSQHALGRIAPVA
jgi:DNA-binding GntR family transcriptional regulator